MGRGFRTVSVYREAARSALRVVKLGPETRRAAAYRKITVARFSAQHIRQTTVVSRVGELVWSFRSLAPPDQLKTGADNRLQLTTSWARRVFLPYRPWVSIAPSPFRPLAHSGFLRGASNLTKNLVQFCGQHEVG